MFFLLASREKRQGIGEKREGWSLMPLADTSPEQTPRVDRIQQGEKLSQEQTLARTLVGTF